MGIRKLNPIKIVLEMAQWPFNYKYRVQEGIKLLNDYFFPKMPVGVVTPYWWELVRDEDIERISFASAETTPHVMIINSVYGTRYRHDGVNQLLQISAIKVLQGAGFAVVIAENDNHTNMFRQGLAVEWKKQLRALQRRRKSGVEITRE